MSFRFEWNPYMDQPHNVASKNKRFWHHFRFAPGYFSLLSSNLRKALPVISRYRRYKRTMYKTPTKLHRPFGVSLSPDINRNEEVMDSLEQLGIQNTLIRIPSWEKDKLDFYKNIIKTVLKRFLFCIFDLY